MKVTDVYIEVDFERRVIATVDVNGRAYQGVRCEEAMYADGKPALMAISFEIPQDSGEGENKSA